MPLYKATIKKRMNDDPGPGWSNVYWIQEASRDAAFLSAEAVKDLEKAVHYSSVTFYEISVKEAQLGGPGARRGYAEGGSLNPAGLGGSIPLFCTVRVDLINQTGRPEIKYLRLPIQQESTQDGGYMSAELRDQVATLYADPLSQEITVRGPNNEDHIGFVVHQKIQMRQTDWKRRSRPGFKRGWVPDV